MRYAQFESSVAQFPRPAAEYISLTFNKFNVNELIFVLDTTSKYKGMKCLTKDAFFGVQCLLELGELEGQAQDRFASPIFGQVPDVN